ncbi:MAG: hypothetical protein AAGD33_04050 [Actinomycetota bacterium]
MQPAVAAVHRHRPRRSPGRLLIAALLAVASGMVWLAGDVVTGFGDGAGRFEPSRLADTRTSNGSDTVDGDFEGDGRLSAGEVYEIDVAGRADVDDAIRTAFLNLTIIQPADSGYATAFACGGPVPNASNLTYAAGQTVANAALVRLDDDGRICVFTLAAADLVVDITGFVETGGSPIPTAPARIVETRPDAEPTIDGESFGNGLVDGGNTYNFRVGDRAGVPRDAAAALLNVTAAGARSTGFFTFFDCDDSRPNASNLNFDPTRRVANLVFAPLDADGRACIYSSADVHVIVDVAGFVPVGGSQVALSPSRLTETRVGPGLTTVDGGDAGTGRFLAGETRAVRVGGRGDVPLDATSALLNVGAVAPDGDGFLSVVPCSSPEPTVSNVNFRAGVNVSNAVAAPLDADGGVCVYSSVRTHVIVDVVGFLPDDGSTPPPAVPPPAPRTTEPPSPSPAPPPTDPSDPPPLPDPPSPGGEYRVNRTSSGEAIRWDNCPAQLTYRIDPARTSPELYQELFAAMEEIERATGFDLVNLGEYTAVYSNGSPSLPEDADFGITFSDNDVSPTFNGGTIGFARTWFSPLSGRISAGTVTIDATPARGIRRDLVWMHELAHLMGLGHVPNGTSGELMQPIYDPSLNGFGPGDLAGLYEVGAAQPCVSNLRNEDEELEVLVSHGDHGGGDGGDGNDGHGGGCGCCGCAPTALPVAGTES